MRRDMDLIRKMVLAIEDHPTGFAPKLVIEGYDSATIGYHAYLLVDAGLAAGAKLTHTQSSGPEYRITHLTSPGHEFAESARNEFIWNQVREEMKKKGVVSATLDVFKRLLDKHLRKQLDVD
ncbi:DUF2513 domain-containing protein [Gemmata sp.]|uniref:DUF2513 domain-containing protein n=1 Tax=Gemmata sp. TaxID=1914242 RepID=UPI003F71A467